MALDQEAQDNELLALESIYHDSFHPFLESSKNDSVPSSSVPEKGGELKIIPDLTLPFYLTFKNHVTEEIEKHSIMYLPPICMYWTYPSNYPSILPPDFTLSCKWMTREQLSVLCKHLDSLWEQNECVEILFTWAQSLKDETFNLLDIKDTLFVWTKICKPHPNKLHRSRSDCLSRNEEGSEGTHKPKRTSTPTTFDPRAIQDVSPTSNLLRVLREYDEEMRQIVFLSKVFTCKVCFCNRPGSSCVQFWPCNHVYCKDCMKSFFEVQIQSGNVIALRCPEPKCQSDANPKQVESLVSTELYRKWDEILLTVTLSSLDNVQSCPRKHCQYPVTIHEQEGSCPACSFVFCSLCRYGSHGVEKCKFKSGEAKKVLDTYTNGSTEEKEALEFKYGKKCLMVMLQEHQTAQYIEQNAKACPKCSANIEKIDGCNKMTCNRCGCYFCWLCEQTLTNMNPYSHYDTPGKCYDNLFLGMDEDDWEEDDEEYFLSSEED